MNQLEVTKCLGCGEPLDGSEMCAECARLDVIYESRWSQAIYNSKLNRLTMAMEREDAGVTEYAQPTSRAGMWLLMLVGWVTGAFVYWYLGKPVILFLCGAR